MKEIALTRGLVALVDDADFEVLAQYKWHAQARGYACRTEHNGGKPRMVLMHRMILGVSSGVVDHINGNTSDNRRENLRACSQADNLKNRRARSKSEHGYKGITFYKNAWVAQIGNGEKNTYLGRFETKEQAAMAYNVAAVCFHGEFAHLNHITLESLNV